MGVSKCSMRGLRFKAKRLRAIISNPRMGIMHGTTLKQISLAGSGPSILL